MHILILIAAVGVIFFIASSLGLNQTVTLLGRQFYEDTRSGILSIRIHFINAVLAPTQRMLVMSGMVQLLVGLAATLMAGWINTPGWIWSVWAFITVSLLLHAWRYFRQANSRVHYQMETDANGQLRQREVDGLPVFDETSGTPGNFSFSGSVGLVILSLMSLGILLGFAGAAAHSTSVVTVGMFCAYGACGVGFAFSSVMAWIFRKGVKVAEFISTFVSQQALSLFGAYIPPINLFEEDEDAAAISGFFIVLMALMTPFFIIVRTWPTLSVATYAASIFGTLAILGWFYSRAGGESEVANRRYQFARLLFYTVPTYMLLSGIWSVLPETGDLGLVKHTLVGAVRWLLLFTTGGIAMTTGASGWSVFGDLLLKLLFGGLLLVIGLKIGKNGNLIARAVSLPFLAAGIVALIAMIPNTFQLYARAQGKHEVRSFTAAAFAELPAAPQEVSVATIDNNNGLVLHWKENAGNDVTFRVERRTPQTSFTTIFDNMPAHSYIVADKNIAPSGTYIYRVVTVSKAGESPSEPTIELVVPKDYKPTVVQPADEPETTPTKAKPSVVNQLAPKRQAPESKLAQTSPTKPAGESCTAEFRARMARRGLTANCASALAANP
jgi:hypothetical protein